LDSDGLFEGQEVFDATDPNNPNNCRDPKVAVRWRLGTADMRCNVGTVTA
jgi:hypothetical protein